MAATAQMENGWHKYASCMAKELYKSDDSIRGSTGLGHVRTDRKSVV